MVDSDNHFCHACCLNDWMLSIDLFCSIKTSQRCFTTIHSNLFLSSTWPGTGVAIGAISGAMIGSIISPRRRTVEGLVFGSIAGALIGAVSDVTRQQEANRIQQQYDAKNTHSYTFQEKLARDYRRAMSVCLDGRGYSVR